jgi:hypothetical protein
VDCEDLTGQIQQRLDVSNAGFNGGAWKDLPVMQTDEGWITVEVPVAKLCGHTREQAPEIDRVRYIALSQYFFGYAVNKADVTVSVGKVRLKKRTGAAP